MVSRLVTAPLISKLVCLCLCLVRPSVCATGYNMLVVNLYSLSTYMNGYYMSLPKIHCKVSGGYAVAGC